MAAADQRVQAILEAGEDPFMLLKLPGPELDALDRPKWDVEDSMITRQYRRLSLCCHPDKNQTEDAALAFHRLGRARDQLLDRDERTKLLQAMTAELLRNRTRTWTSGLSATDEMAKSRERREEAKRLREEEARRQAALIRMHADERRARLERAAAARHRDASASVEENGSRAERASTSTTTDSSRKRPRMSEPDRTHDAGVRRSSVVSPDRREERVGITTARDHTGNASEQSRVSQSRTSRVNAGHSKLGQGGHRYDDSDDSNDSSESEGEVMTAAAKARARKKAAGGKRRARSAMFI